MAHPNENDRISSLPQVRNVVKGVSARVRGEEGEFRTQNSRGFANLADHKRHARPEGHACNLFSFSPLPEIFRKQYREGRERESVCRFHSIPPMRSGWRACDWSVAVGLSIGCRTAHEIPFVFALLLPQQQTPLSCGVRVTL